MTFKIVTACAFISIVTISLAGTACKRTPDQQMARGKELYKKGDYARALLEFRNAARARPKDPEPLYQLALTFLARQDYQPAIKALKAAVALNPHHTGAQLKLAELMSTTLDKTLLADAERRIHDVLQSQPGSPDALNLLAVTEGRLGKLDSAEQHLRELLNQSPERLKAAFLLADLKLATGDKNAAETILKQTVVQNPKAADAIVALGEYYVIAGNTALAEQQFRRALESDKDNSPALLGLAALKRRAGQMNEAEGLYRQLSALPTRQYKDAHSMFLFAIGRRDEAIAELEKLYGDDPKDRDIRTRLVEVYFASSRLDAGEKLLTDVLGKNARDAEALLQRTKVYLIKRMYKEAEADLGQVLHFKPDSAEAHYLLAKVREKTGAAASARNEVGEAVRLNRAFFLARLELARALIRNHEPKAALDVLNAAPDQQKNHIAFVVERNWANLTAGNRTEVRKTLDGILRVSRIPDLLMQDALLYFGEKNYAAGRKSLEEVLKENPENIQAVTLMTQSYLAQKQGPAAIQKVREYAAQRPQSAALQEYLGSLLMMTGDRAAARHAFDAAKVSNPVVITAELNLANLDAAENRLDDARRRLTSLLAGGKQEDERKIRLLLAGVEDQAGNYAAATSQYQKILEADPNNVVVLNNLAFNMAEYTGQREEALKLAQKAKELAPDSPAVADTLGWVLYRKGLYAVALTHLEYAASRQPTAIRQCHLAMAYFRVGKPDKGKQVMDAAVKLDAKITETRIYQELVAASPPKRPA